MEGYLALIKEQREENDRLQQKVEQLEKELNITNDLSRKANDEVVSYCNRCIDLENIRKEANKLCDEMLNVLYHYDDRKVWEEMKDILNKGSDK